MKANLRIIRKQRKYSEEFKKQLVLEFESGKYSVAELEKLHGVSNPTIYNWILVLMRLLNFNSLKV